LIENRPTILEVTNLSNRYEGLPLLRNVGFDLKQGEILCLLGPSGSGKTTLLRLVAGLESLDSGSIFFRGRDIRDIPPHKRNFGMMFQEYALFPHKNVQENIAFGLEMQKCSSPELKRRVDEMLSLVGLTNLEHRKIDELSGGERQRVALARSLAPEPQLLLLDEPLGSLDRTLRDRLATEIRTILKRLAVTAIFVTHDQAEAFSVADKVAILHNGLLLQFDTPEELYRHPADTTVARFLGFTNIIEGRFDGEGIFHSKLGRLPGIGRVSQATEKATLLIRPEAATLRNFTSDIAEPPIVVGTVNERVFQGSTYRVSLQSSGCHLTFNLPIDPPPPSPGESIELALNPAGLVCIEQ
jgi:ABC-type Fe3+/spermidine/putrescine transport system ATPase subunit